MKCANTHLFQRRRVFPKLWLVLVMEARDDYSSQYSCSRGGGQGRCVSKSACNKAS